MTEEVKPEVKVEAPKVTLAGNDKVRMTRSAPAPVKAAPKAPPKMVVGDRSEVENFVDVVKAVNAGTDVVKKVEPKLPASVLAEQAAGRAALNRRS